MDILAGVLYFLYLAVIVGLALYGFYNLVTAFLYLSTKRTTAQREVLPVLKEWPRVTIQLPIFNEKYIVKRLLRAVTQLDYPADRLQIQVLDDSTDETVQIVSGLVEKYQARGIDIEWMHRTNRRGYKAGALSEGFQRATGEFLAIFDADFVPRADWLKKTVPRFQDPALGCLQTRWGHTNRNSNSLTLAEAIAIDGHFVVEQSVRAYKNFFMNFNGTAGIWRRACIEDAGGWHWDTLTEDLDLSYRAQMRGWKFDFLPDVIVPGELPSQVEAFKKQQFRWAKGSFQVVRKLLPKVFTEPNLRWSVRLMCLLHLTGYFVHPLMIMSLLLTLPVGLLVPNTFKIFPISMIAGFGPPLLYLAAQASNIPPARERIRHLPLLLIMGFGISLSTTIAVIEGLSGKVSAFVRTPKLNESNTRKAAGRKIDHGYIAPISPVVWGEIALGIYALATIFILAPQIGLGIAPWLIIYMLGYFYIAGLNLIQHGVVERKMVKVGSIICLVLVGFGFLQVF